MLFKHSLYDLLTMYNKNKVKIHAYLQNHSVEGFHHYNDDDDDDDDSDAWKIAGMGIAVFLVLIFISLGLWIWALVITIKHWPILPDWAKVVCVLGLLPIFPGGVIVALIVAYVAGRASSKRIGFMY